MDQMDDDATYNVRLRRVLFEYRANNQAHSASISEGALERLAEGQYLAGQNWRIAAYRANWEAIHALAETLRERGENPVFIRLIDLQD
jgi:hypothetical protein